MKLNAQTGRILAYLRAHVTLRLLEELPREVVTGAAPGRLTIQLRTPGGPACHVRIEDGEVAFVDHARFLPSVTLFFPRPANLVATLTGSKAPVIPVPSSLKVGPAIRTFRALTSAVQTSFADPDQRPRLLLLATLFAVEEVANRDPYVAARIDRIPHGTIAVRVAGDDSIRAWVRRDAAGITCGAGDAPSGGTSDATDRPNAELEFADRQAALDLLTGTTPAMLALAERRVRLYGRIGMIQNLFPVLDRVSDYLGG